MAATSPIKVDTPVQGEVVVKAIPPFLSIPAPDEPLDKFMADVTQAHKYMMDRKMSELVFSRGSQNSPEITRENTTRESEYLITANKENPDFEYVRLFREAVVLRDFYALRQGQMFTDIIISNYFKLLEWRNSVLVGKLPFCMFADSHVGGDMTLAGKAWTPEAEKQFIAKHYKYCDMYDWAIFMAHPNSNHWVTLAFRTKENPVRCVIYDSMQASTREYAETTSLYMGLLNKLFAAKHREKYQDAVPFTLRNFVPSLYVENLKEDVRARAWSQESGNDYTNCGVYECISRGVQPILPGEDVDKARFKIKMELLTRSWQLPQSFTL